MDTRITIRHIAGFCPEEAVWKMMADVSEFLLVDGGSYWLSPDAITVDGNSFVVEPQNNETREFLPPEQTSLTEKPGTCQMVWMLGALAYYMSTGHVVFGGYGGAYQQSHPSVALPTLPKSFNTLSQTVQECLKYAPSERISLKCLTETVSKGWIACSAQQRGMEKNDMPTKTSRIEHSGDKWPEKMIEI